ncbi:MAG: 4Fe-4S binding protein [Merdibacter sp.]
MNDVYPRDSVHPGYSASASTDGMVRSRRKPDLPRRSALDRKGLYDRTKLHRMRKVHAKLPATRICAGSPYQIAQEHCLHCGLCAETCPVHAILPGGERA